MEKRELTCINCPMGCALTVETEDGRVISVAGNTCPRGDAYARKEVTDPTRIVTSSVYVTGSKTGARTVSVKTKTDVPKQKIFEVIRAASGLKAEAPVKIGDVLCEDIAGTGVPLVATRNVE